MLNIEAYKNRAAVIAAAEIRLRVAIDNAINADINAQTYKNPLLIAEAANAAEKAKAAVTDLLTANAALTAAIINGEYNG